MHYAGIIKNDVVNGYDVCVSFWSQGCPNGCPGCQNPETWDFNGGIEKEGDLLIEETLKAISNNGVQRNLSFLGGEPLCRQNIEFTRRMINVVKDKYPNIMIFVWTGYLFEELETSILELIDVLVDGRFEIENRDITLAFRGSTNQRVINVKKSLEKGEIVLWET